MAERPQCIGRFRLTVPESLIPTGRSQSIYRVDVSTLPLPDSGPAAAWEARLARIRARTAPPSVKQPILRSVELEPGASGVWFYGSPLYPNLVTLEVMKTVGRHLLVLVREADAGKEEIAERLVGDVLAAYVPGATYGFCVGSGALVIEPSQNESARIVFEDRKLPDFKITFDSRTVREPDTESYSDVSEEREAVAAGGGTLTVLRERERVLGQLEGNEISVSVAVPGQVPFLRFTWHYPGVPGDAGRPRINFVGTARLANHHELQSVWEKVLPSLTSAPLSQR